MRLNSFLAATLVVAVFLSSCKKNAVRLEYTNAKGEVPELGNLSFRFNRALVNDSLLNTWDSTEYISFEPRINGRFRWESPDNLIFSPSQPLLPSTTYKARIKKELFRYSKYDKVENGNDISFYTPALALDDVQVTWTLPDQSGTVPVARIDLYFNYRIHPDALKQKLRIVVDNKETGYELQTASVDNKFSLLLKNFQVNRDQEKDYDVRIVIAKGLVPDMGKNSTQEEITQSITMVSPYVLSIQNVESEHDGTEGFVRVKTNQQLSGNLKDYIRFSPEMNFSVEGDETGIIIRSEKFDIEKSYSLTFLKGLRGKIGGILKEDAIHQVAFGELEPGITFSNSKAVYLSKLGATNIEVRITNVPKIKLVISKIYENNLLMTQRYDYYPTESRRPKFASYDEDESGDGYYYEYNSSEVSLGDVIYEKEIDTRSLKKSAGGRLLDLSEYEDRLQDFKGIYHVLIRSTENYWIRDSRYISMSDIGLMAREGNEKIFVFANSLKNTKSLEGVDVLVYSGNNQLLGSGATNKDGVAEISYVKKDYSGFKPAMIIAKTSDDFNYLPFNSTRVNTSRFDVGGKRINPSGLDAFVYAERDIYRPGEKLNYSVILRNREWKSPGELPLKLRFLLPNGKELKTFRKGLNEQGSLEGNLEISTSAITGSYTLEVYTSNDILLASKDFRVEEFVPDRISVNLKMDREFAQPGQTVQVSINARNFFGPPASGRNYEIETQVRQKNFSPAKFRDYDFSLANQKSFSDKKNAEGKTDENGNAVFLYEVPETYADRGVLQANFYTTVFDETGRPVSRNSSIDIYTQEVFFGIKYDGWYYHPLNQPAKFLLAAVNKDGNAVNTKAKVHVIKHEYRTSLRKSDSYFRYESQRDDKLMIEQEISVGAGTVYSYIPRSPGDYEIRVYRPGANAYVSTTFYSYGSWGWADNSAFEVNTEGNIDISTDKEGYMAGETVKALFKTPFSGKMLVTLETDRIIKYQYVDVEKRNASLDLKLSDEHLPNVYITATLIKPHEFSDMPLTVAHGFRNVKVEEKDRKLKVEITAQRAVRSKTSQKITVKTEPGSFVTLAAVDNGVLQVTDFKTPDPYNYFYQKKALQVNSYDLYPLLFPELRARLSSTGGDADVGMEKRVNPMPAKRIKIVSYWSGIAKTNGKGESSFEVSIPQFSGEIRLMAVAYKSECFGNAESTITVADPVVISTALPRFLSPGDTVSVPVTLSNTTKKDATTQVAIKTEGPFNIIGDKTQSLILKANSEGQANFRLVADQVIGIGSINVEVNALGEKFSEKTEMSVRPPSTLQKLFGNGTITGGRTEKINIGLNDFMPGSIDYKILVSRSPVVELASHLSFLVQYPYGCTEQTVSAAFPQLYYGDMADMMGLNEESKQGANYNILEAIRKIKMRQLYNGALTLWDGGGTEDWWATIYAAHFLLEAKKAGFDVENGLLETMLAYINNRLKTKETITYYYNRDQNKKIAPKEVAYGLYVLALAGRANVSTMNYYKAKPDILALDSRYLLSAAYAIAGDKRAFNSLLPSSFTGEESVPQTGGSYYSDVRDEAIALNALIEVDPGNAQIGIMARHVGNKVKTRRYLSTQETAFSFLALGKLSRKAAASNVTADIRVDGKIVGRVNGGSWSGNKGALKGTNIEIVTKGNGSLYYFWEAEGISKTGSYKEEDNFISARKFFYDRNGRLITGNTFKQNELIIVALTLEKNYATDIYNVVLTDLLPAGFEIENPRTKEIPGMDWITNAGTPTAMDVRDDRINLFVDLISPRQVYYYAVRAVSPGNFKMGPVSADAMYNGEYHSYHGAGIVRILP